MALVSTPSIEINQVLYEQSPDAFDVVPKHEAYEGVSPFSEKTTEGPSVLTSYKPLKLSGKLEAKYKYTELTPGLGREYYDDARLVDILKDEALLRDLAITVSQRGVVFFKNQAELTIEQQKKLADSLGRATGAKPASSSLHIHPTALTQGHVDKKTKKIDPEVLVLNSQLNAKYLEKAFKENKTRKSSGGFHSDITFEPVPSDYSVLRLAVTPSAKATEEELARPGGGSVGGSGGDTLWGSGYGLAEKISPGYLAFLETLTGTYSQPAFKVAVDGQRAPFYSAPRGAPENIGTELSAVHPVVRTNPVTGWKSIFAIGEHFTAFNDVSQAESDSIRSYLLNLLYSSPELQARYRWSAGDIAIWDNRSTYHSIITDLRGPDGSVSNRIGLRTLSIGERPFLDPNSTLRIEAIRKQQEEASAKPK